MSATSAPISIASPASAIRSPADGPTMPAPSTRRVSGSTQQLRQPPAPRPIASARPDAAHGKTAFSYATPCSLASVSVSPTQATSGSV